jgi:hypothetical protein
MKKSLLLGLLGLTTCVVTLRGQGFIALDNYDSTAQPLITYGSGIPANGISGAFGTIGAGITGAAWNVGMYFAAGDVTGSIFSDPTGFADPSALGGGLALATGSGSTTTFFTGALAGQFAATANFQATAQANGLTTVTVMVIAYGGPSYVSATYRSHSAPFTIGTLPGTSFPNNVGDFMSPFSVNLIPEPSTFALAGMSSLAFLIFGRRRYVG